MGSRARLDPVHFSRYSPSVNHGSDESYEGHEGHEGYEKGYESDEGDEGWRDDDTDRRVPVGGRDHWAEDERGEGCRGCIDECGCGAGEEVRLLQACWHAEHEAEEQACHEGPQGREPLHQGAVC